MRLNIIIVILSFVQLTVCASKNNDTSYAALCVKKAWSFRNENLDSVMHYSLIAKQIFKANNHHKGMASVHNLYGLKYLYQGENDSSIYYFNLSLNYSKENNLLPQQANALANIGNAYYRKSLYKDALQYYSDALIIREQLKDSAGLASSYNQLAMVNTTLGNLATSLEKLNQALTIRLKLKDTIGIAQTYSNIAINYFEQENFQQSVNYYLKALNGFVQIKNTRGIAETQNNLGQAYVKLEKYDEAIQMFDEAIELFEDLGHKKGVVSVFTSLGWINYFTGDLYKAQRNAYHALRENISMNDLGGEMEVLFLLGKIELESQNSDKAISYFKDAEKVALLLNARKFLKDISFELAMIYEKNNNYLLSNQYLWQYTQMKDSLLNEERILQIENLNASLEFIKNQEEIGHKNQQISILKQQHLIQQQRLYIGLLSVSVIIVLAIIFVLRNRYNQQKKQELLVVENLKSESEKALFQEQLIRKELEQEKMLNNIAYKNQELQNFALHIVEKNELLQNIKNEIEKLKTQEKNEEKSKIIKDLLMKINQNLNVEKDVSLFNQHIEQLHADFFIHLADKFPFLTDSEKKLCAYLRMNLTSKDISAILNISPKSVDMNRYRLRKKLNMDSDTNLNGFLAQL
jgi:tetratricopeptide (TPR) repeat protein